MRMRVTRAVAEARWCVAGWFQWSADLASPLPAHAPEIIQS
jgi:hypothetical protein